MTNNLRGIILMTLAAAGFVCNDAIMKYLSQQMPLAQAIFLRGVPTTVALAALAAHQRVLGFCPDLRDLRLIGWRTFGEVAASITFLVALVTMPLATLTAIMQSVPLAVTLAAALFLRAPIGVRRLAAIIIGFAGVMLIVRPGAGAFGVESILGLLTVGFVVVRDLTTRQLDRAVPSVIVALVASVAVMGMGAIWMGFVGGWVPVSAGQWALVCLCAAFLITGYLGVIAAMRVGDVDVVAPLRYVGLIFALVLGWVVFGDWPDLATFAGAAIVVATGIYTFHRERKLARAR
ncbi:DMT family transporter [Pontitalea aquivivens]|uniref:DMT family transporter n=1 Tax=Pontitalea aquivivens TaxID=3388663 RepID=UPI0039707C65